MRGMNSLLPGLKDRKWNYDRPTQRTKVGRREGNKRKESKFKSFLLSPSPRVLQMTLLTTVKTINPSSVMALHDGRGFADLPEKLKAPRIFS